MYKYCNIANKAILNLNLHSVSEGDLLLFATLTQGLGRPNGGMGQFCVNFNKFLIFHNGTFSL